MRDVAGHPIDWPPRGKDSNPDAGVNLTDFAADQTAGADGGRHHMDHLAWAGAAG